MSERALRHRAIGAHVEYSNRLPLFGRFEWVSGPFWAKKGCFGAQMRSFGRVPPDLAPPPRGATGKFLAQTWIRQGHPLGSRMARVK